eukprot:366085-Chlamydomonas_euryale.AAC.2
MLLSTVGAGVLGVGALPHLLPVHAAEYRGTSSLGAALLRRQAPGRRNGTPHPLVEDLAAGPLMGSAHALWAPRCGEARAKR